MLLQRLRQPIVQQWAPVASNETTERRVVARSRSIKSNAVALRNACLSATRPMMTVISTLRPAPHAWMKRECLGIVSPCTMSSLHKRSSGGGVILVGGAHALICGRRNLGVNVHTMFTGGRVRTCEWTDVSTRPVLYKPDSQEFFHRRKSTARVTIVSVGTVSVIEDRN